MNDNKKRTLTVKYEQILGVNNSYKAVVQVLNNNDCEIIFFSMDSKYKGSDLLVCKDNYFIRTFAILICFIIAINVFDMKTYVFEHTLQTR